MAAGGLAGLKTRELAREIGVANGAVYNLVEDMDELILRVGSPPPKISNSGARCSNTG